jgi:ADP-ribosyl-[dinitrogen reductase] hydrolase
MALCLAESLIEKRAFDPRDHAGESSRTTRGAQSAVDACRYFAGLLLGALLGRSKEEILSPLFCPGPERDYWQRHALSPAVAEIANGSFRQK